MKLRLTMLMALAFALLLLGGCPAPDETTDTGAETQNTAATTGTEIAPEVFGRSQYPIPIEERPYQDVHESVKQAWFLVETAYFVIKDRYLEAQKMLASDDPATRKRGSDQRTAVSEEIDTSIFLVNPNIEQLFIDAIREQPENPLNVASYAYYLKPRKRQIGEDVYNDAEPEALALMDQAIEMWPDEASFYLLKVHIMTEPHKCHDWLRSQLAQDIVIAERMNDVHDLLTKAEKYYPDNFFINYYHATLTARYTDLLHSPDDFALVMREIKAGDDKSEGFFFYPPPLPTWPSDIQNVKLLGTETEPKYIDQWNFFGHYDPASISLIIQAAPEYLSWPKDKEQVGDLMFFLYKVGRTRPFDRTMFSLQLLLLNSMLERQEEGSPEALKLAEAIRVLNEYYREVANELFNKGVLNDPKMIDVRGVNAVETTGSHQNNIRRAVQARQAAFLKQAGEILDLEFPLPENPNLW
ncbi:hypothetical protein JW859_14810 [bacterium]|nr:hypothetical protein [bacterium]